MKFASAEQLNNAIDYGASEGGIETLERLAEYLAESLAIKGGNK
jgi:hypothetical protein